MRIKSLEVEGLSERISEKYIFHDDINIITGLNGSGKTTLLKLIWFLISGNVERIAPEMSFQKILLHTSIYKIAMLNQDGIVTWEFIPDEGERVAGEYSIAHDGGRSGGSDDINRLVMKTRSQSLYFPTFRRIEGGYSMSSTRRVRRSANYYPHELSDYSEIQHEMDTVSNRLSVNDHKFICPFPLMT